MKIVTNKTDAKTFVKKITELMLARKDKEVEDLIHDHFYGITYQNDKGETISLVKADSSENKEKFLKEIEQEDFKKEIGERDGNPFLLYILIQMHFPKELEKTLENALKLRKITGFESLGQKWQDISEWRIADDKISEELRKFKKPGEYNKSFPIESVWCFSMEQNEVEVNKHISKDQEIYDSVKLLLKERGAEKD